MKKSSLIVLVLLLVCVNASFAAATNVSPKIIRIDEVGQPVDDATRAWVMQRIDQSNTARRGVGALDVPPPPPSLASAASAPGVVVLHEKTEWFSPLTPVAFNATFVVTERIDDAIAVSRLIMRDGTYVTLRVTSLSVNPGSVFLLWDTTSLGAATLDVVGVEVVVFNTKTTAVTRATAFVPSKNYWGSSPSIDWVEKRYDAGQYLVLHGTFATGVSTRVLVGGNPPDGNVRVTTDSITVPFNPREPGGYDVTVEQFGISDTVPFRIVFCCKG